ncbi:hypothetical protein MHO82_06745 [Vibrio sp. Of7-15]|uniref:hypothetical protein n=1 Tax=Vibrio sp. Of7-15 TaxID=2724879 RepID=UPI001EF2ED9F|nr:hypothetical protein [Vibrio sp. Of7-15]MCG7496553.1 hypothetical protein [Vibrio sp. Of7-15]
MKKVVLATVLSSLISVNAFAVDTFVGVSFGQTDMSNEWVDAALDELGKANIAVSTEDDSAFAIQAGVNSYINNFLEIQSYIEYKDFGTSKVTPIGHGTISLDHSGVQAIVMPKIVFNGFYAGAKVGGGYLMQEMTALDESKSDSGMAITTGLEFGYKFKKVIFKAGYDKTSYVQETTGKDYDVDLGVTYAGINYNF